MIRTGARNLNPGQEGLGAFDSGEEVDVVGRHPLTQSVCARSYSEVWSNCAFRGFV